MLLSIMPKEIELKAHVDDSKTLKNLLEKKAEYLYAFEKDDSYFFPAEFSAHFPSGVRIRSEKRTFPDGHIKSACFLTYKVKDVREGIEINDEHEFEVSSTSGQPSEGFKEFLTKLELKQGISKSKKGWAFSDKGITMELVEVAKLGWFLELEIISSNADVSKEKMRLLDCLKDLNIDKEAIESRFYSQMLEKL